MSSGPRPLAFDAFSFDPGAGLLTKAGEPVPLTRKQAQLLALLVGRAGELVDREEIVRHLWPDVTTSPGNLAQNVWMLRKALGPRPEGGDYVETEPRRGYRFAAPVRSEMQAEEAAAPTRRRPFRLGAAASIGLAVLLLATVSSRPAGERPRGFAVLPLRPARPDPATAFLSATLAEQIGGRLARLPSLRVRAAALAARYRDASLDTRAVGRELGADALLLGTYDRQGDTLRVSYQVVAAVDGHVLCGETLTIPYGRLWLVPDLVAEGAARGLRLASTLPRLAGASTNAEAYEYYLRGMDYLVHRSPRSAVTAVGLLEKATALDPGHAASWAELGTTYRVLSLDVLGWDYFSRAEAALRRARELAPDDHDVLLAMADFRTDSNRVEQAVPLLRRALQSRPDSARAHWRLSYAYRYGGLLEESLAEAQRALSIDPPMQGALNYEGALVNALLYLGRPREFLESLPERQTAYVGFYRGFALLHLDRRQEAVAALSKACRQDSDSLISRLGTALERLLAEGPAAARGALAEIDATTGNVRDGEALYKVAQVWALAGDAARSLAMLERSVDNGFFAYPYMLRDPLLANLRNQPQLAAVLEKARIRHEAFRQRFAS